MEQLGIYSIALNGCFGIPETLARLSPARGYFLQPMINSADDSVVFWGREEGETGFNIWRHDLRNGKSLRLTDDRAVTGHPYWTADGTRIVCFSTLGASDETDWRMARQFELGRAPRNLWMMDRDGGNRLRLTHGPHVDERPCISPDGRCVVFVSDRSGAMNLWAVDVDGGNLRQVTRHNRLDYRPSFSPDGRRLAFFTRGGPQGSDDLCIMEWHDGETHFPVPPGRFKWIHGPFWTADGASILIHCALLSDGSVALWLFNLANKSIERIELPGIPSYAHGSLNRRMTLLVFDSHCDLAAQSGTASTPCR